MGFFDRFRSTRRQAPTPVPRREPPPNYELTVQIGEEVSRISIPIDLDDEFAPLSEDSERGPRQKAAECWIPAGRSVEVGGQRISAGLIYVGKNLRGADSSFIVEPALIDPRLEVGPGHAEDAGYWPTYQSLSPARRGAYLRWLAGPRRRGEADQAQLFIYYYGLERRLLDDPSSDPTARSERGALIAELERLQREGEEDEGQSSFTHHLESLLDYLAAEDLLIGSREVQPPSEPIGWEVPLTLRMMIGELAASRLRLPAELAKSWILTSPEAYLRKPAERCPQEFARLFEIRYRERFGEGLALPEGGPLRLSYRTANRGLQEAGQRTSVPDICSSAQLVEPLRELGRDCCDELAAYSRWLGRHPEGAGFKGTALLPAPLLAEANDPAIAPLRELLARASAGEEPWFTTADELIELWEPGAEKLGKKEAVLLCQLLEKLGYGLEPDPRFGSPNPKRGMPAVLFTLKAGDPRAPSPAYATASLLLHLLAAVASADGIVSAEEKSLLETHIHGVGELYPGERARLHAHASWLTRSQVRFASLRKDLAVLSSGERQAIAQSIVALAAGDGEIDPEEVKTLQKIFKLLELDPESVYAELHAVSAGDGPVVVREGAPAEAGEPIPARAAEQPRRGLDRAAIDAKIEETATVSTLLAGIFSEPEEEEGAVALGAGAAAEEEQTEVNTLGLSVGERAFAVALAERDSWSREEVEELAGRHEVMVDGALEAVNDAAFEICGAPFSEGDQPIEIDSEVAKEMLA
jgi:tellurite resistance protein